MPVELTKDLLVDLGGWSVLKEARRLNKAGLVKACEWEGKLLKGEVHVGGSHFYPKLNLRSTVFAENQCNCKPGQSGQVCAHAIALCLHEMAPKPPPREEVAPPAKNQGPEAIPILRSLVLSGDKGIPLRFRIWLPPNLERSASADRIMVRLEAELGDGSTCTPEKLDRGKAYQLSLPHLSVASQVESWCEGKLFGLLQLSRKRLKKMLKPVRGEPVVFWVNRPGSPIAWAGDILPGVHGFLEEEEKPEAQTERPDPPKAEKPPEPVEAAGANTVHIDGSPNFLAVELPSRSAVDYEALLGLVKEHGFKLEPSNRRWWLRDRHKTLNFLAEHYETLQTKHRARFSPNFKKQFKHLKRVSVRSSVTEIGGEYEVSLNLGKNREAASIQTELNRGRLYWETGDKLFLIPRKTVEAFSRLQRNLDNRPGRPLTARSRLRLKPWQLTDAEGLIDEVVPHFETPKSWKAKSRALKNLSALKEAPVEKDLSETLRLYQKIGTAWLYHLFQHRLAGILADEMGLGKTVQALALVQALFTDHSGHVLIVCPAGLLTNWQREAGRFTPGLKTRLHHGTARATSAEGWEDAQVTITSYTTLTRDIDWIRKQEFLAVIADEAQHIKNRDTRNARSLRALNARGRFLLTGTPIENSIQDLQSLFDFLLPGYLAKAPAGVNNEERTWYYQRMRRQAAPYILRRTKRQVAPELPEKIEQVVFCDPTSEQKSLYESVRKKSEEEIFQLEMSGAREGRLKLAAFTQILRLRQVCADPRLIEETFEAGQSAKWLAFREILDEAMDGDHRILVFSQFVSVLSLLRKELDEQAISYCYIDGSTRDRLGEADRFNHNDGIPVFLISLKAGGTGLNLTGADTVVHFDPWWNPAVEAQATDRAHRIGQTRTVTSIKLIVAGSVEEKVLELQRRKADLLKGLFEESEAASGELSLKELKALMQ